MSGGLVARPSREFAPAGDLLSCVDKKVGKETTPAPSPLRFAAGSPAMLEARGRAELTSLRCVQTGGAKSVLEASCARAPGSCASRLLQRGAPEQPNSQLPNPKAGWRRLFIHPPFSAAEEHSDLQPRAQHASSTDSAQLFNRSVAKGVLRGVARREHRREPEAQRRAVRSGATLCLLSGRSERRSPAGATSRLSLGANPTTERQP